MKGIAGGCWIAGLLACATGLYLYAGVVALIGAGIAASCWQAERRAAAEDWRKAYPTYKY